MTKGRKGFWSRFRKEKKNEPKGKEPCVIGGRSEGAAPVVAAAAAMAPDAAVNNVAKPPARTRTIRKQKLWAGPEAKSVNVRAESPPPRTKKGWKRLFGNW